MSNKFSRMEPLKLEHKVTVDVRNQEQFDLLKGWVRENIPSTERFTPEYEPDEDYGSFGIGTIGSDDEATSVTFKFKTEDLAMAFKIFSIGS